MALDLPTEDVQRLEARIFQLEEEVRRQKAASNAMSQSVSILQVDMLEIGNNFLRGEQGRLQVLTADGSERNAIIYVSKFLTTDDPDTEVATHTNPYYARTAGFASSVSASAILEAISRESGEQRFATFGASAGKTLGGAKRARLNGNARYEPTPGSSGLLTEFYLDAYSAGEGRFWLENAVLRLDNVTSDPTPDSGGSGAQNGDTAYRSDTHKPRMRVNDTWENLATETYVDAAGGGVDSNLQFLSPTLAVLGTAGQHTATISNFTWPTANALHAIPFALTEDKTLAQIHVGVGASSGNIDVAILNSSGSRLTSDGGSAMGSANTKQSFDVTNQALSADTLYYVAIAIDNTSGGCNGWAVGGSGAADVFGHKQVASSYPIPSSNTLAAPSTVNRLPLVALEFT